MGNKIIKVQGSSQIKIIANSAKDFRKIIKITRYRLIKAFRIASQNLFSLILALITPDLANESQFNYMTSEEELIQMESLSSENYSEESSKTKEKLLPYFSGLVDTVKQVIHLDKIEQNSKFKNRENWMRDIASKNSLFSQRYLWSISIPGTHHSAVYDVFWGFGKEYAICQNSAIEQQLYGGIRFFDLRLCDDKPRSKDIWISHHFVSYADFQSTIKIIAYFVKNHEKEIVIISITSDKGRKLSNTAQQNLQHMIHETFGDMLIFNNEMNQNLQTLWEKGKKWRLQGILFRIHVIELLHGPQQNLKIIKNLPTTFLNI